MSQERQTDFCNLTFTSAILDSIPANIAVIDSTGKILAVNLSWQKFADANQMPDNALLGIGANYLDVCRAASADPNARAAMMGIIDVMRGRRTSFYHEYPCHSPSEQRWFALRAMPLIDYPRYVVVAHENITERISAEIAARPPKAE
ncbi:MAG: PAS domain-containing protein [Gammaproteobacteria bacterium]|nr:PAS domain-containing protein [Gammaproteobacteria bacterium]